MRYQEFAVLEPEQKERFLGDVPIERILFNFNCKQDLLSIIRDQEIAEWCYTYSISVMNNAEFILALNEGGLPEATDPNRALAYALLYVAINLNLIRQVLWIVLLEEDLVKKAIIYALNVKNICVLKCLMRSYQGTFPLTFLIRIAVFKESRLFLLFRHFNAMEANINMLTKVAVETGNNDILHMYIENGDALIKRNSILASLIERDDSQLFMFALNVFRDQLLSAEDDFNDKLRVQKEFIDDVRRLFSDKSKKTGCFRAFATNYLTAHIPYD